MIKDSVISRIRVFGVGYCVTLQIALGLRRFVFRQFTIATILKPESQKCQKTMEN
jgi:hypothetical protein